MRFNLSAWALRNRSLVIYLMLLVAVVGAFSYARLGQSEDPPFTFKAMVVRTFWPGASAEQVARQISEPVEKAVMDTGDYDRVVAFARPGESTVLFVARDSIHSEEIADLWYQIRKKVGDIRHTLPPDVQGPFFDDEFGTTFGNIYALTGEGFDYALLKDYADRLQLQLQRLPDVGKVELIGLQEEKIWIELSNLKAATLGVPLDAVQRALAAQNAVVPAGFAETPSERIRLRVSGQFETVEQIRAFPIRVGERTFRIGDVAEVYRGFNEPPAPGMRFMGEPAIGVAVAMREGGDILRLGARLEDTFATLQRQLPAGMQLRKVADQPAAVKSGVGEFVRVLVEALAIVLVVSFFSLGLRTGLVVALSIPLVLGMTFAAMYYLGIGLHKISLGALVLALGLLVDDAIIAVEMMAVKLEQGLDRLHAASFAWSSTAFPMLTGTLVTAAGFLPIATAESSTGEYTRSIFQVVTLALLASWLAAVLFVPLIGARLLPAGGHPNARAEPHDPYAGRFYQGVRRTVRACVRWRWWVIALTLLAFLLAAWLFRFVPQQFFPASTRLELMVDLKLAEGASLKATAAEVRRLEALLAKQPGIDNYVAYVGTGSPRFYLPLDQQLPAASFAQFVVLTESLDARERLRRWLIEHLRDDFPTLRGRVTRLENGPPVGYPIQLRVSGEHVDVVRALARRVAEQVRRHPALSNVHLDWDEPSKVVRLNIDQDRARALGISSAEFSRFLQGTFTGTPVSLLREDDEQIEILLRASAPERQDLSRLPDLAVPAAGGRRVPLQQIATLENGFESGVIWHRNRLPTVTVRADVYGDVQPATVIEELSPALATLREQLPSGYLLQVGGTVEESARGQASVYAGIPLFVGVVLTLLMLQLRSFSRMALVVLTAPLGFIGVTAFLLLFQQPFGFVAMLGTIALAGMIMRNSVILVDQIEQDVAAGSSRADAVVEATVRRLRPIVLTALASVLAMIPLSQSVFFGPMAVAIMGGLIVATVLTLLFVPALYAAWLRVPVAGPPG